MDTVRIGIDLGTTNTLAYYMRNGKPTAIKFPGGQMLPSEIYKNEDGTTLVGLKARHAGTLDPNNRIRSAKTYMGDFEKTWELRGESLTPTDVATAVLKEVRNNVIRKLKLDDDAQIEAVITVPAYFNANQTDETKKAGTQAGLNVLGILTEPRAAAIANIRQLAIQNQKILVADLGGGTFDLSVLEAGTDSYRTLAIDGDRKLGGDNFDEILASHIQKYIEDDLGIDLGSLESSGLSPTTYYSMRARIWDEARNAKTNLSDEDTYDVNIGNLFMFQGRPYSLEMEITRDRFEQLCEGLFKKVRDRINRMFDDNPQIRCEDINTLILAGGSCYIPRIKTDIETMTGLRANTLVDPSTMVAIGACLEADAWNNPVAQSAGHDIISHSLGIEVVRQDGTEILRKLLDRGMEYPCRRKHEFTTFADEQEAVEITIYEAGSDMENVEELFVKSADGSMKSNHDLYGSFVLDGIQKAPRGVPRIEVTFEYDRSRLLTVTAEDQVTGAKKKVKVTKGMRAQISPKAVPVDFELLLDVSGSMYGTPLRQAKEAAEALVTQILDLRTHRLGIVAFGSMATQACELTSDVSRLLLAIRGLSTSGSTNMTDAIKTGQRMLDTCDRRKVMIIVTDGEPDSPDSTTRAACAAIKTGIDIMTIAAGPNANRRFLSGLATKPEFAFSISDMGQLADIFDTAYRQYVADVNNVQEEPVA